jgi:hypothetical protein
LSGSGELLNLNSLELSSSNVDHDNLINVTSGSNKSQFRNIKEFTSSSVVSTQSETPNTIFDYLSSDEISILESLTMSADDSIVFILDGDAVNKTVNVNFWRTGRINSSFAATNTQFSAYDSDNEPGVDFGNEAIWSKINTSTEFKDYAVWLRSRNWYKTDSDDAGMIIRAKEYGPTGDKYSFKIEYPSLPNQSASIKHSNISSGTVATYTFASDDLIATGITSGTHFSVKQISGDNYRLKFKETSVDFSSLNPDGGDIVAITDPNVTSGNKGIFRINDFDAVNRTIDITNADAVASDEGLPQSYEITTTQDIVGTPGSITITCTDANTNAGAPAGTVQSGDYFALRDRYGNKIVFWYAVDNVGSQPTLSGVYQYIRIGTVITTAGIATAASVASATANIVNSAYPDFTASYTSGNSFNVINNFNGPVTLDTSGNSSTGFTYSKVDGISNNTLGGKYFTIHDIDGSVAVWMNVYGEAEPIHGEDRSIQVVIPAGSSANSVANLIKLSLDADSKFDATVASNKVTVTNVENGLLSAGSAETSGFTISTVQAGVDDEYETISSVPGVKVFPLTENDCETIATYITENSSVINAVAITGLSSGKFTKATKEETSSVGYGHSVGDSQVNLFDGESFVKTFSNTSPHFTLKKPLILQNQSLNYDMRTCPNPDSSDVGEFFKLLPKTVKNVKHHLSHRALSQLPIVADIDISNKFRRVQIKSKKLGTSGSVEVVGGRANLGEFSIFGDGQVSDGTVEIRTSAYPSTINTGDVVRIYNEKPAKRVSRLKSTDTVDVVAYSSGDVEYVLNKKEINSSYFTSWKVTDVSASSYGVEQGTVWRWEHNEAGGSIQIISTSNGSVSTLPNEYPSSGTTPGTAALEIFDTANGTTSAKLTFNISANSVPNQGDYFTFQNELGYSFAVWFSVNGNSIQPTGTPYTSASTKIKVDILSTDTPNTIVNKIKTALDNAGTVFSSRFTASQKSATSLEDVSPGDLLGVWGSGSNFIANFNMRNQSQLLGDGEISNFPIIAVDAEQRYMDVVNPNGVEVSTFTMPTTSGNIEVFPSVGIRWRTKDTSYIYIDSITVLSGVATVSTSVSHGIGLGETVLISDSGNSNLNGSKIISETPTISSFKFSTSASDGTYTGAVALKVGKTRTRYKIESLGFNNLIRISRTDGDSPYFTDCGIAVDDYVKISGSTFSSVNNGFFRILAVDNNSFVIENPNFKEELNTFKKINNLDTAVIWQANSTQITGVAGSFANISLGDWIKKKEDTEDYLVQVIGFNTGDALTATSITIGSRYRGSDSTSEGVALDQENGVGTGAYLDSKDDFMFYSADSIIAGDSLVIDNLSNPNWFKTSNSGVFAVKEYGTKSDSKAQFIRVYNSGAISQSDVSMSANEDGMYILENENYKYESIRSVEHAAINEFNANQRTLYVKPIHQVGKISDLYGSKIQSLGKLGFDIGITSGVDGYVYYTGLMQTVQRIIDGYEPDAASYPGRRAVGSLIEVLPPLIKPIEITIDVTTRDGINLTDISNDIKSTIINYVNSLGVGQDVILSEITARAMAINGVNAVTFTNPAPTNERIAIDDDQKAFISPDLISLS